MSVVNPFWPLGLTLLALGISQIMLRIFRLTAEKGGRFRAIDGLRGYLAFFVFLHHAMLWHAFVRGEG